MKKKIVTPLLVVAAVAAMQAAPKKTATTAELLEQGTEAVMLYDTETLDDVIEKWKGKLKKGADTPEELRTLQNRALAIGNMLGRVEKIKVLEWYSVDSAGFFNRYRLSDDAGKIGGTAAMTSFVPSMGREIFFTAPDSSGHLAIMHADILDDGTRGEASRLDIPGLEESDTAYPFLAADGTTLYFANNADTPAALGGYDIYMTRRDENSEYFEPTNMGMPYNSPGNDYLLVYDETTGLGWWATDRNADEGQVSIFVFLPNESRVNFDAETEGITELAFMPFDEATSDAGRAEVEKRLASVGRSGDVDKEKSFTLSLGDGRVYTSMSQFGNDRARALMEEYLDHQRRLQLHETQLQRMRDEYAAGNLLLADKIISLEKQVQREQRESMVRRNAVIRCETAN